MPSSTQHGWERRFPHVELDAATLAAMLQPALPGHAIAEAEPLSGGLANTNYRVRLAGMQGPVVLRVYTRNPAACRCEVDLHRLVCERVPVADVLYADCEGTVCGRPYMVTRWVEGAKLDALLAEVEDAAEVGSMAVAVGETLARIGAFTFARAGFFGPGLEIAAPLGRPREALPPYVEDALFQRGAADHLGEALAGRVWRLVREHAALLDAIDPTPRLVHADYKAQNLLMRHDTAGGWAVAAVLDWEFALTWTPLLDLAILLRYAERLPTSFAAGVAAGYTREGGVLPPQWRRILKLLDLMNLCEFLARPDPGARMAEDVRALLAATVEHWDTAGR